MPDSLKHLGEGLPPNGDVSPWWRVWERNQNWRDDLAKKASYKSLDIPEEMGDIGSHNKTIHTGFGLKEIVVISLLTGGAGLAGITLQKYLAEPVAEKVIETVIDKKTKVWDYKIDMEVQRK